MELVLIALAFVLTVAVAHEPIIVGVLRTRNKIRYRDTLKNIRRLELATGRDDATLMREAAKATLTMSKKPEVRRLIGNSGIWEKNGDGFVFDKRAFVPNFGPASAASSCSPVPYRVKHPTNYHQVVQEVHAAPDITILN